MDVKLSGCLLAHLVTQVNMDSIPAKPIMINGPRPICPGSTQTYSITPVAGATSYTWTVPTGWTINSGQGTNSITLTAGTSSQVLGVISTNTCGSSAMRTDSVQVTTAPAAPATLTGSAIVCSGVAQSYTAATVTGATTYNWVVPAGWVINSGQGTTTISATPSATSGVISVAAANVCLPSVATTLAVSSEATPLQPAAITGSTGVCSGVAQTYSIPAIANATTYTWAIPTGWTLISGQGNDFCFCNAKYEPGKYERFRNQSLWQLTGTYAGGKCRHCAG